MTQLDKYELHELLGAGATADVYRATDTTLGREVALKILKPSLVADTTAFNRFIQEARAAAALFHPNIATVYEIGESEGRYFIAMRYIPGKSLARRLTDDGPLPWAEVQRMASQLGAALDFAHSEGFLHRDIKPANIICAEKGDYVLTDFGLVRAMMNTGLTTHTGALLGTPAYIAPEIWNGEEATPASDQYALACVLYEAITGQPLFRGATPQAVITQHLIKGPQFPENWPSDVPEGIAEVLGKALSPEPGERYPQVKDFVDALCGQRETEQQQYRVVRHQSNIYTPQRRGRKMWLYGVVGLLLFFIMLSILLLKGENSLFSRQIHVTQPYGTSIVVDKKVTNTSLPLAVTETPLNSTPSIASTPTDDVSQNLISASPTDAIPTLSLTNTNKQQIVFSIYTYAIGNSEIYKIDIDGNNKVNLTNNDADDIRPSWAPDGKRISFVSYRDGFSNIFVMTPDGTDIRQITHFTYDQYLSPSVWLDSCSFAFDGNGGDGNSRHSYTADVCKNTINEFPSYGVAWTFGNEWGIFVNTQIDGNPEIYAIHSDGSGLTNLTNNTADDWAPALSPTEPLLAFKSNRDGQNDIFLMDIDSKEITNLTNGKIPIDPYSNSDVPVWSPDGKTIVFSSTGDLYKVDIQTKQIENLIDHDRYITTYLWSPDGNWIAYSISGGFSSAQIHIISRDGTKHSQLYLPRDYEDVLAWSSDGEYLVCSLGRYLNEEYWTININTQNSYQLTDYHADRFGGGTDIDVSP